MNYDRFLTRVWDKKAQKMLFVHSPIYIDQSYKFMRNMQFNGIAGNSLIISYYNGLSYKIDYIPFGDRFVPMICLGLKDKNLSSIYEYDLLKNSNNDIFMVVYRNLELDFIAVHINYFDSQLKIKPVFEMLNSFDMQVSKIIGNRWEHPELLETNK